MEREGNELSKPARIVEDFQISPQEQILNFATKADTLKRLEGVLGSAELLPNEIFTARDWRDDEDAVLRRIAGHLQFDSPLIVRSSAINEDRADSSLAGHFASVGNIDSDASLRAAIETVIGSYGAGASDENQFFVQPMLRCPSPLKLGHYF